MSNTFIQEAFQNAYLVEDAEEFSLNVSGPDDTESFLDIINADDDEMISDVYDLEAEAKEELKQSYIGKVILDCNVCHSNVFFDKDQITEDEDGLCCVDIECPYCMSNEGYTIIGEVKPFVDEEEPVDEIEDVEVTVSEDEPEIEIEDKDTENEESLKEDLKESIDPSFLEEQEMYKAKDGVNWIVSDIDFDEDRVVAFKAYADGDFDEDEEYEFSVNEFCNMITGLAEGLKADEVAELRGAEEINGADGPLNSDLEGSDEIRGPKYTELNEGCEDKEELEECGDPEAMEEGIGGWAAGKVAGKAIGTAAGGPVGGAIGSFIGGKLGSQIQDTFTEDEDLEEGMGAIKGMANEITEDIEDVSVSTSDETMTMTTKEDGGVVIETSPNEEEIEEYSGEEMIAPLEPETEVDVEDAIEANDEEEEEIPEDEMIIDDEFEEGEPEEEDFEEFDEESFDELGESYLKRCYENVTSFKTSGITMNENKEFIIEGKIGFDSGNEKDTQFIFSPKTNENGKLKLEGFNKQISKGKKTFKLNCSINDKALICESLNYNYKGKNDLNESVRVYGTVKRK